MIAPSENGISLDINTGILRCDTCGSVLHDNEKALKQSPLKPRAPPTKRIVSTKPTAAVRASMLACIPGIGKSRAEAILRVYPTFRELVAADVDDLAQVVVKTHAQLGKERATAITQVLHH